MRRPGSSRTVCCPALKILVVASYGLLGGAELSLLTFLAHRPPDADVRALVVTAGPVEERLLEAGVPVWTASGYEGRPGPGDAARFTRSLDSLLRRWRPDVVWALGQKGALLAAPACRRRGVPIVWHKVDLSWDRQLAPALAAAVDAVISVSEGASLAIGPLRHRRVKAIVGPPITLDPGFEVGLDGPLTIGTLARGAPYKGHDRIIRAAALLSDEFPELRVLASCGPVDEYPDLRDELLALASELGLGGRVELPAWVPTAAGLLEQLTVFVNATYRDEHGFGLEGLSGAMLEASWAGVPVVAARGGGTAEGVVDGETGRLVDRADPELLAAAIRPYLRDPELRARTGAAGRVFTRANFAPAIASERLFAALAEVARG